MKINRQIICSFIFVVFLVTVTGTALASDVNVELAGHFGGYINAVSVVGNYAYVGQGQDFLIMDITNPSSPVSVGKIMTKGIVRDINVSGNYAYVASNDGLAIVDISNPYSPILIGSYHTAGYASGVSVSGNYAYVADTTNGLLIVDISNPSSPILKGSYSYSNAGYASSVSVSGTYAYVDSNKGLLIIDISNPSSPVLKGIYSYSNAGYSGSGVSVSGNYAYVVDTNGFSIIDISNPSNPVLRGSYSFSKPGYVYDSGSISVSGNYAYVANGGGNDLVIIDISNPSNPILIGSYYFGNAASSVSISGNYAYVADDGNGLLIFDISNPSNPTFKGRYNTALFAAFSVSGNYAYVANSNGLLIFDISNPSNPIFKGRYTTPLYARYFSVSGNYAYVTDSNGLLIFDISNPSNPTLKGSYKSPTNTSAVSVSGNYAYLANGGGGNDLVIVDISNPSNPVFVGSYSYNNVGDICAVSVSGNYAYVADSNDGLLIVDISNPSSPILKGSYKTAGYTSGVSVSGNYAYVANSNNGLLIVDISNPSSPVLKGSYRYSNAGYASDVYVSGNYAYVADSNDGLLIVDISNPSSPVLKGSYKTGGWAERVSVSGNIVYLSTDGNGLVILKTDIQNQAPITVGQGASTPEITQKFIEACDRNGGLSVLGNPTSEIHSAFGFEVQDFPEMPETAGGVIMYNSSNSIAYFIHGAIWDKYYAYPDANKTRLGHIASDEKVAAVQSGKTTGRYTKFETGTIHWISDRTGENINHRLGGQSFVTYGDIDKLYTEMGGTYSELGFPIMDQVTKADGYDYCMFDGGIIVWDVSTNAYKPIITSNPTTIQTSFSPKPNGYKFENFGKYVLFTYKATTYTWDDEYPWSDFEDIYGDQDKYEYGAYTPTMIGIPHTKAYHFYDEYVKSVSNNGNCFGFSGSSLQLFKDDLIAYDPNTRNDNIPEGWNDVGPYKYGYSSKTVRDWIKYYTALMFSKASIEDRYTGTENVYNELRSRMSSDNWKQNSMIMCYSYDCYNKTSGEMESHGHTVVPYKMVEDGDNIKIYIYDSNAPTNFTRNISINRNTWQIADYDVGTKMRKLVAISLDSLDKPPEIPDNLVSSDVVYASLLFTDNEGNKLGYYQGEFKDEIPDAKHIVEYSADSGSKSRDSYYIPDSSIKMELYGKNEGASDVTMLTPNGAITANVPVSANSLDEFKMLNDGKGVEFKSGIGTQSLNLTVSVETTDSAQIVYANFSQIGTGGSIDLLDVDGTINIENDGQPTTCSLYLAQFGNNTNSNDSIENIVIEGNSIVYIKPSNWNDIANSEITIEHDVGGDGSVDFTEILHQKDTMPPSTVLNLQSTNGTTWLNWTWTNPSDPDFNHTEINLNGTFQTNTLAEYFNATGLQPEAVYTIGTRTVDNNGNVNETWINSTATTGKKATPTITWSNPADIVYGTALNSTQLNATASVPGALVYSPAEGTVLGIGKQILHIDFTPEDATNYTSASKEVEINVLNSTPAITWNDPADITYGTALNSTQLNATASVPGTLVYSPAEGTVPGVGKQTMHVDFAPEDATNYTSASKEVEINVLNSTPVITWSDPVDITYGTVLNSTQLNATASVPGALVYSPAEGTVPGVGKQILHVDFTHEDATNYTSASKEVEINVLNTSYSIFKSVIAPDESGDCIINSPGDIIPYRIVVKNDGNVDLTGVSVNDPMVKLTEPTGDDIDPGVLNPGEAWVYIGNYRLTQDDIDNGKGSIDNTATVSCNELPYKTSSVQVPIEQNSKLQIYTSVTGIDEHGDKIINNPGDVINYQVAVKNDGKVDLTWVKVSDPMIELTEPTRYDKDPGVLNPGEVWVYNGDYSVTQDDIDNNGDGSEFIENTATVNCDQLPSESSSMVLPISHAPLITVTPEPDNSKVTPVANFSTNITSGYAPLSVQFTNSSQNATSRSWDFNNDGMADSSDASPVYTYTAPGTYITNLNVSKGSLTDSKMTTITVLKATSSSSDNSGSSGSSSSSDNSGSSGSSSSSGESNHIGGGTGHAVVVNSSEVNSSTGKTNTTGTATVIQSQNSTLAPKQSDENTAAKTEQKSEQKNNTNVPAKESKSTPGFEIVCGMTAMLAVYLYRRK